MHFIDILCIPIENGSDGIKVYEGDARRRKTWDKSNRGSGRQSTLRLLEPGFGISLSKSNLRKGEISAKGANS